MNWHRVFGAMVLASVLVATGWGRAVEARTVTVDLTAGANATVKGVYITKDYWFELSEDWAFPEPAVLDLRFSHTPILVRQLSTLTIAVNGSPVESIYLDATNQKFGSLLSRIPGKLLKGGMNVLSIVIKMRSDLKDLCDDVHNPALWTLLEKESRLLVSYDEKPVVPDLADFPRAFANPDLLYSQEKERIHVAVIVPSQPSAAEMDAIGALGVAFGQEIGVGAGEFRVVTLDKVDTTDLRSLHLVAVGGPEFAQRFAAGPWNLRIPAEARTEEGGRLLAFASPLNPYRRMLVVTGRDDDSLKLAADHLKTPLSLRNLKGPSVRFEKPPAFDVPVDAGSEAAFMVRLKDLRMSDLHARGKFYHSLTFTMPNPFVGKVREGAFIRLSMSHSELLLPESSSLLLKVNGEPVRSLRLTRDTASRNTWDILIPLQYLTTRFLTFEVELFLDIGDPDCYYNHPEMAWLTLHNDTLLYLPVDMGMGETLSNYPYIFLQWNRFDRLGVVLAEPMTEAAMTGAFNIVAYLSQSLRSPNWVQVLFTKAGDLSDEQRQGLNLIAVGPLGFFLGDPAWAALLPKELTSRGVEVDRGDILNSAGFLSLAPNIPNSDRRVLMVTGRSDTEIRLAAPHLYAPGSVEWVRGTLSAVTPDEELKVLLPPTPTDLVAQFDPAKVRFEEKDGKMVPVMDVAHPEAMPARYNLAYVVLFLLMSVLVILVIVRLRALSREGHGTD